MEKKCFDNGGIFNMFTNVDNGNTYDSVDFKSYSFLNAIILGTDRDNRIGRSIYVRYVQLTIDFQTDNDVERNGVACRYAIVLDRAAAGVVPAASAIWSSMNPMQTPGIVGTASLRNFDNMNRFRVLLDKQHTMTYVSQGTINATTSRRVIQHYIPIHRVFQYVSSSGDRTTAAALGKEDLRLWICPSSTNCCIIRVGMRTVFNDA